MPVLGNRISQHPLPLKGGGREGVSFPCRINGVEDGFEHAIEILSNLRVPEAKNAKPTGSEPSVPTTVD
jgi:hypothetical protein